MVSPVDIKRVEHQKTGKSHDYLDYDFILSFFDYFLGLDKMTITNPTAKNPNPTLAIALGCQLITLELKRIQAINANEKNPIRKKIVPTISFTFITTPLGNCSLDINLFGKKQLI